MNRGLNLPDQISSTEFDLYSKRPVREQHVMIMEHGHSKWLLITLVAISKQQSNFLQLKPLYVYRGYCIQLALSLSPVSLLKYVIRTENILTPTPQRVCAKPKPSSSSR